MVGDLTSKSFTIKVSRLLLGLDFPVWSKVFLQTLPERIWLNLLAPMLIQRYANTSECDTG